MNQEIFFAVFNFFNSTPVLSFVAIFFATWFPFALILFLFFYEWHVRKGESLRNVYYAGIALIFPATLALAISEFVKFIAPSPRPFLVFDITPLISVSEGLGSFPSTHATFFSALALTAYLRSHKLGKWYFAGMVLIGVGRIAVGVHFPIDIFAGIILGSAVSFIVFYIENFLRKRRALPS